MIVWRAGCGVMLRTEETANDYSDDRSVQSVIMLPGGEMRVTAPDGLLRSGVFDRLCVVGYTFASKKDAPCGIIISAGVCFVLRPILVVRMMVADHHRRPLSVSSILDAPRGRSLSIDGYRLSPSLGCQCSSSVGRLSCSVSRSLSSLIACS